MRYVVEVAQQRNLSRAADRLHVAQQALSQQIKTVEAQLGLQLFTRNNRGVELTPAGVVFVQEARRVLTAADRAVSRTQAAAKGEAGSVRIAYTLTSVYDTLPAIVERVEATHRALKLELREVFGADIPRISSPTATTTSPSAPAPPSPATSLARASDANRSSSPFKTTTRSPIART